MTRWPVVASLTVAALLAFGVGCQAPTAGDGVLLCVEDGGSWAQCGAVPPGWQARPAVADYGVEVTP